MTIWIAFYSTESPNQQGLEADVSSLSASIEHSNAVQTFYPTDRVAIVSIDLSDELHDELFEIANLLSLLRFTKSIKSIHKMDRAIIGVGSEINVNDIESQYRQAAAFTNDGIDKVGYIKLDEFQISPYALNRLGPEWLSHGSAAVAKDARLVSEINSFLKSSRLRNVESAEIAWDKTTNAINRLNEE